MATADTYPTPVNGLPYSEEPLAAFYYFAKTAEHLDVIKGALPPLQIMAATPFVNGVSILTTFKYDELPVAAAYQVMQVPLEATPVPAPSPEGESACQEDEVESILPG